jgi:hypothetical protein
MSHEEIHILYHHDFVKLWLLQRVYDYYYICEWESWEIIIFKTSLTIVKDVKREEKRHESNFA